MTNLDTTMRLELTKALASGMSVTDAITTALKVQTNDGRIYRLGQGRVD